MSTRMTIQQATRALCLAAASAVSSWALAQPSSPPDAEPRPDRAAQEQQAQDAFDQGREAMRQGNYAMACALFERSLQLDPGLGTQFRLAECYEQAGRLASAWHHYVDVAETARKVGMQNKEQFARARAQAIESRVPRLTVRIAPNAPSGVQVSIDGRLQLPTQLGQPLALDPRRHVVLVRVPGKPPERLDVDLTEGVHKDLTVGTPQAVRPAAAAIGPTTTPASTAEGEPSVFERYPWTFVAGGVALGLAGAGAVVGGITLSHYDRLSSDCAPEPGGCSADDRDAVETEALVTNVLFAAAGATAALAALLLLTGDASSGGDDADTGRLGTELRLQLRPGGAVLVGRF